MGASTLTASICGAASAGRLVELRCTAGRGDRPYPEEHGAWTLAVVRRGMFNYRGSSTNGLHAVRPGWLILGRPGAAFECSHDHDGGDDCLALEVGPGVIEEVASATPGCRGPVFLAPVLAPVTRVAALMDRLSLGAADFDEAVYDVTSTLLAHAHHARGPSIITPRATDDARIDAALSRIEQASHEPTTLADLAGVAGLSPFHFLRVFRRVTGTTPHQYVLGARLRRAARLLLDTSRPVTDIAYDVGFGDLSNFVRTFHGAVGCSPRAFRRGRASRS